MIVRLLLIQTIKLRIASAIFIILSENSKKMYIKKKKQV